MLLAKLFYLPGAIHTHILFLQAIKRETRRFIRMQDTWFRKLTASA